MNLDELKKSIENPQPVYEDFSWHFPPVTYYVLNKDTKEIVFAFLDKSIFSYESIVFIAETFNNKINIQVLTKEKYEELYGVQDE